MKNGLDTRTKWCYCIGATGRDAAYALVSMYLLTYVQYTMKLTVAQALEKANAFTAQVQPRQTLLLRIGMVAVPLLAFTSAYILIRKKYKITEEAYQEMVAEIAARRTYNTEGGCQLAAAFHVEISTQNLCGMPMAAAFTWTGKCGKIIMIFVDNSDFL